MNRRTFIIAAVVLVLLALLIGAYFMFKGQVPENTTGAAPNNPFGLAGTYSGENGVAPEVGDEQDGAGTEVAPRLIRITNVPVAVGTVAFPMNDQYEATEGTTTATIYTDDVEVRFVERASGNVYRYRAHERSLTRLTNQTLPGVEEVSWTPTGSRAFLRYLPAGATEASEVETYSLPIGTDGGYFLQAGLEAAIVNAAGSLVTLISGQDGATATIANADGSGAKALFTSTLSSFKLLPAGTTFVLQTKASANADGYAFIVRGGSFERLVGPFKGLTALPSPSGAKLLYGYTTGGNIRTELLDTTTREVTSIPIGVFPEKCVWSSDETTIYCAVPRSVSGTLPDDWYQGVTSFSDRIWRIDLTTRVAALVVDPGTASGSAVDGVSLTVDSTSDMLFFVNRIDGSLWAYDI